MFKQSGLITYYALTPIHVGAGSSVSYIDLPVQRERHTSFPIMAGSGLKGVFRALAERDREINNIDEIFGPDDGNKGSSCVAFTDAKILLYPVRSVKNTFAWITCPFVLKRFKEDLESTGKEKEDFSIHKVSDDKIIVASKSPLIINNNPKKVGLEEFVFDVDNTQNTDNLINAISKYIPNTETTKNNQNKETTETTKNNQNKETTETTQGLSERFAIVSDNVFTDLVNYAVEVRTRIKINQTTGTASGGALFTVEMVPSETIFYSLVFADEPKIKNNSNDNSNNDTNGVINKIKKLIDNNKVIQVGGDETIGLGFVKVKFK